MIDGKHQVMENSMWGKGDKKEGYCMCAQGAFVVKLDKKKKGQLVCHELYVNKEQ